MKNKTAVCKKLVILIFAALMLLSCVACGHVYTCAECGKKVTEAYYDPFDSDRYYCKDCAKEYFAPFPYTAYRVK